ncbi:Hap5 protein [Saccharomycopsis crataegensis]|uniref:Hap5 protein n=1 Tax=Saccharomycopsis crataegensis TaxID=43959 RepID=A0AAV5QTB4_9ASCO|nr:Hap5 protein [Saccharomycopsis crataegensis]
MAQPYEYDQQFVPQEQELYHDQSVAQHASDTQLQNHENQSQPQINGHEHHLQHMEKSRMDGADQNIEQQAVIIDNQEEREVEMERDEQQDLEDGEDDDEQEEGEDDDEEEEDEDDDDMNNAFANVGQGLTGQYKQMMMQYWQEVINSIERSDHDFKNHQLPLARIKKVMKTDEGVRMISAEAPILFAKGCDIFITELTMRAWIHAEENKRRTLQKSDISAALQKSDMFDFLIDIVPRDEEKPKRQNSTVGGASTRAAMSMPSVLGGAAHLGNINGVDGPGVVGSVSAAAYNPSNFYSDNSLNMEAALTESTTFNDEGSNALKANDINSTQSKYNSYLQQYNSGNVSSANTLNSLTTQTLNGNNGIANNSTDQTAQYLDQQYYQNTGNNNGNNPGVYNDLNEYGFE